MLKTSGLFSLSFALFLLTPHIAIFATIKILVHIANKTSHNIRRSLIRFHPSIAFWMHITPCVEHTQAQAKARTKIFSPGSKFLGKFGPGGPNLPETSVPVTGTKIFGGPTFS